MPRIIDNIESHLLPILRESLLVAQRADFILICAVGSPLIPILITFSVVICPVVVC